jgi:hypothetical protein
MVRKERSASALPLFLGDQAFIEFRKMILLSIILPKPLPALAETPLQQPVG